MTPSSTVPTTSSYMTSTLDLTQSTLPQGNSLNDSVPFDYLMDLPSNFDWVCDFSFNMHP